MGEDATCVWQLWKTSCTLYIFVLCTFMCWYLEFLPLQDDCSWPPTVHAALEMWPSTVTSPTWAAKAALLGHLDDQCRCMKNVALPGLCFFQTLTYGKWKWMLPPRSWRFSAQKFQKFPQKYATHLKEGEVQHLHLKLQGSSGKWKTYFLWGSVSLSAANSFVQIPACFECRKHFWENDFSFHECVGVVIVTVFEEIPSVLMYSEEVVFRTCLCLLTSCLL